MCRYPLTMWSLSCCSYDLFCMSAAPLAPGCWMLDAAGKHGFSLSTDFPIDMSAFTVFVSFPIHIFKIYWSSKSTFLYTTHTYLFISSETGQKVGHYCHKNMQAVKLYENSLLVTVLFHLWRLYNTKSDLRSFSDLFDLTI